MSIPAPSHIPPLDRSTCQVWWARPDYFRPAQLSLLDAVEVGRRGAYRLAVDRDRFTLGVVLTRTLLGAHLGVAPDQVKLDRTCPDCGRTHGQPRLLDADGPAFSVSHSGDLVGVAFTDATAVGLDVEQVKPSRAEGLFETLLSAAEREDLDRLDPARRAEAFFRYWVRKEALLKATGEGLRVPLKDVIVTAADQAPRLLSWAGRPDASRRFTLHDLSPHDELAAAGPHLASLAVIDGHPTVREFDAAALLGCRPTPDQA